MSRELTPQEIGERSLIKTYRKQLWNPFIAAVKRYELVSPGDRIAVCISGGKDSLVLAKLTQELGCNKIALGHHFSDVVETTLLGLFYGAQLQAMPPKLHSKNFPGMELIRPLYCVHEDAIIAWKNYNHLRFLQCACRFTEERDAAEDGVGESKRQEIKLLLRELKKTNPNIEKSIFRAIHGVQLDTFPGFKYKGQAHSFLDFYDGKNDFKGEL